MPKDRNKRRSLKIRQAQMPLTDLLIDMGQGDMQRLESGKTVWISPKAQKLVSVTVTTKEGLVTTKDLREPISMVEVGLG
ncbi:MAG TPA: hypothetical protein VNK44_05085 [Candidatus Nitrosotenuis sp.]|nr:hypothetical protein [Candidatus Nitrosotenuis sp.]